MGFGPAGSFQALVNFTGEFTGPAAANIYGSDVPLEPDRAHWDDALTGVPEPAMDPSITLGTRKDLTPLDYAALADLGWEVPLSLLPEPNRGLLIASALLLLCALSGTRRDARRRPSADRPRPPPSPARPREPRRSRGWAPARG